MDIDTGIDIGSNKQYIDGGEFGNQVATGREED